MTNTDKDRNNYLLFKLLLKTNVDIYIIHQIIDNKHLVNNNDEI